MELHDKIDDIAEKLVHLSTKFDHLDGKLQGHMDEEMAHQTRIRNGIAGVVFTAIGGVVLMVLNFLKTKFGS